MADHQCYRELINNSQSPIVFSHILDWEILSWSLEDWCRNYANETLSFRCGKRICQKDPYWESLCTHESHTMSEFLRFCDDQELTKCKFWYYDYKHLAEYAHSKRFEDAISWSKLGFPEKEAADSTIWIGSPGAHTPCHVDSYGFNLVAQVYGRKRWLLFPPSETDNLRPTRVPYEESSVYSSINFSCYENLKDEDITKCYLVDLNPGDVLFVPAKWWHYVENLTPAISVNTWIPHPQDHHWKLEEALVKYFISSIGRNLPLEEREIVLNPNEMNIEDDSLLLMILDMCRNNCSISERKKALPKRSEIGYRNQIHIHKYKFVPCISGDDMKQSIKEINVCDECNESIETSSRISQLKTVINAFCHPSIITEVKNKLLSTKMK